MPTTVPTPAPLPTGTLTFLLTDIEGSTRMWQAAPVAMQAALARHDAILRQGIEARDGHVFKTAGDAFFAVFATPWLALEAALAVQQALQSEDWPPQTPIRVRMALHSGAAELRAADYFGTPVNHAARLLSAGHGGQTLVSTVTCELCHDRLPDGVGMKSLGEYGLKDLARKHTIYQVAHPSLPQAFPPLRTAQSPLESSVPSIAVLPFVNLSRDEENEYFADGLAEELLNVLTKIRGLRVAARSSAFTFKGKGATVAEVGRALNVVTVLEGSVRKAGNRMRVSVQLVKVVDGYQLWSETYDRTLDDIFAVQDDIAQSVLKELHTTLLGETAGATAGREAAAAVAAAVKGRSTDPEAHRIFLQARYFIDRNTRDDTARGIDYLKEALALEPEFALAWGELGRAYASQANWGWSSAAEGFLRSREAITRALALEPDLAEAHAGMGWIQMSHDFDWHGAERSYRRALELAPGNALVLHQSGFLVGNMGRFDEGIALGRRAVEQDPLSAPAYFFLGLTCWTAQRPADAVAAMRKALDLAPKYAAAHVWLSMVLLQQGMIDEALQEALLEPEEWARLFGSAVIQHAAGRQAESDQALHELAEKCGDIAAYQVAQAHGARGEISPAFAWLERALAQRDPGIFWTKVDPLLRSLHTDPRWGVFLHKVGHVD
jgi:TolB-like protein/class 3 adenylate cyclase/cytochrome c-type biogenesis protein CcmH/NrfG